MRLEDVLDDLDDPNVITSVLIRRRQRVREDTTVKAEVRVMALMEGAMSHGNLWKLEKERK